MSIFTYANLASRINKFVYKNGKQLITGDILQSLLHDFNDSFNNWLSVFRLKSDERDGVFEVSPEGTVIPLDPGYPDGTNYRIIGNCYDENGGVGFKITDITVNSFKVTPDFPAFFNFNTKKI